MNHHHCKIQSFSSSSSSSSSTLVESIAFWLHERTIFFESKSLPVRVRQQLLFRKRPCRSQRILQLCSFEAFGPDTTERRQWQDLNSRILHQVFRPGLVLRFRSVTRVHAFSRIYCSIYDPSRLSGTVRREDRGHTHDWK